MPGDEMAALYSMGGAPLAPAGHACQAGRMMKQALGELVVETGGRGLVDITRHATAWVAGQGFRDGLLTLFCRHTSASLIVTENASPEVLSDLDAFLTRLVREDGKRYAHDAEGPDDMPAHIRAALTQTQLSVPLSGGRLQLGTWQGIFLFEHRRRPHRRTIALHLLGE